jgi:NADH:ubiquinone oxidoreductase subunit C
MFSYEVLSRGCPDSSGALPKAQTKFIVYNLHSLYNQDRFFVFAPTSSGITLGHTKLTNKSSISSISELFPSGNWLEREVSELHGVNFSSKKDLRNLMLQYGDSTSPFQKSFPSIGLKEVFYEPLRDTVIQNPISVQL